MKSFEIQETNGSKKLVSNDELAILYKTLGKPQAYSSAYNMFRVTHIDKGSSESIESKWKNLTRAEKAENEDKYYKLAADFDEQFAQYLLRLPEVCRKSEIANSKILTKAIDKQRMYLTVQRLSGQDHVENQVMFKDNSNKKQRKRVEEDSQDEERASPKKKAKKTEVEEDIEKPKKTKQAKKLVEEPMEEETEIPPKTKKIKKTVEEPMEEDIETPMKTKKTKRSDPVEEAEMETPKKDKKKQKDVSPVKKNVEAAKEVTPVKKKKVTEPVAPPK